MTLKGDLALVNLERFPPDHPQKMGAGLCWNSSSIPGLARARGPIDRCSTYHRAYRGGIVQRLQPPPPACAVEQLGLANDDAGLVSPSIASGFTSRDDQAAHRGPCGKKRGIVDSPTQPAACRLRSRYSFAGRGACGKQRDIPNLGPIGRCPMFLHLSILPVIAEIRPRCRPTATRHAPATLIAGKLRLRTEPGNHLGARHCRSAPTTATR